MPPKKGPKVAVKGKRSEPQKKQDEVAKQDELSEDKDNPEPRKSKRIAVKTEKGKALEDQKLGEKAREDTRKPVEASADAPQQGQPSADVVKSAQNEPPKLAELKDVCRFMGVNVPRTHGDASNSLAKKKLTVTQATHDYRQAQARGALQNPPGKTIEELRKLDKVHKKGNAPKEQQKRKEQDKRNNVSFPLPPPTGFEQPPGLGQWEFSDDRTEERAHLNFGGQADYGFENVPRPTAFQVLMIRHAYQLYRPDLHDITEEIRIRWVPFDVVEIRRAPFLAEPILDPPLDPGKSANTTTRNTRQQAAKGKGKQSAQEHAEPDSGSRSNKRKRQPSADSKSNQRNIVSDDDAAAPEDNYHVGDYYSWKTAKLEEEVQRRGITLSEEPSKADMCEALMSNDEEINGLEPGTLERSTPPTDSPQQPGVSKKGIKKSKKSKK